MRTLRLAGAFTVVIAGPALACRGTVEYPPAFEQCGAQEGAQATARPGPGDAR